MKVTKICKNKVRVVGEVASELKLSHELKGISMYSFMVNISRRSGTVDEIPVVLSSLTMNNISLTIEKGVKCEIIGEYRSYNEHVDENTSRLKLYILAKDIYAKTEETDTTNNNSIECDGYIATVKPMRETPGGRKIMEALVAINRYGNKSSYIPCIIWSPTRYIQENLTVGSHVELTGRIQSRKYTKRYEALNAVREEIKTAYEVSVQSILID